MALQSMTGFARVEGQNDIARWTWEVRSVNGKGLDFRFRFPPGNDALQPQIRKLISGYFKRGNLHISLVIDHPGDQAKPVINQSVLDAVLETIASLQEKLNCPPPAAENILRIKGILETVETGNSEEESVELSRAIIQDFEILMKNLSLSRTAEGADICKFLDEQLLQLEKLTLAIADDPSRSLDQIRKRLSSQITLLLDNSAGLDPDRLHQEAAILATRADLAEELDRLKVHIEAARALLCSEGPVGRKLDFICQELNRECNTICSKSNAIAITNNGLDMKVVIDQFREQVQNME